MPRCGEEKSIGLKYLFGTTNFSNFVTFKQSVHLVLKRLLLNIRPTV